MTNTSLQVGSFDIDAEDLLHITTAFVSGEPVDSIAARLNYDVEDVSELLGHPGVFDQAILAKQKLIHLLLLGPISDRLVDIAINNNIPNALQAIRTLKGLAEMKATDKQQDEDKPKDKGGPTFNVLLAEGGYDTVVRALAGRQERVIEHH